MDEKRRKKKKIKSNRILSGDLVVSVWWLRSPGNNSNNASNVNNNGNVNRNGNNVNNNNKAARADLHEPI